MKKIKLSLVLSGIFLTNLMATDMSKVEEVDGYTISEEIAVSGQIRTRYEYADDGDSLTKDAHAFTNRLLVNTNWKPMKYMDIKASFLNITNFGNDSYSYRTYGPQKYAYVNEAPNTIMPELYLRYDFKNADTVVSIGNQKLSFNNERHVGVENWRQGYRTYQSLYVKNNTIENLELELAYANKSNYEDMPNNLFVLNGRINFFNEDKDKLNLSFYDFMIEDVSDSYGLILAGEDNYRDIGFNYRAEYSLQSDASLGTSNLDGSPQYWSLGGGIQISNFGIDMSYSVQDKGYLTPYASNHNFNGAVDMFFAKDNIKTFELGGFYDFKENGKLHGKFFSFADEANNLDLGNEFDIDYTYTIAKNLDVMAQLAMYKTTSKTLASTKDANKAWLQVNYKF